VFPGGRYASRVIRRGARPTAAPADGRSAGSALLLTLSTAQFMVVSVLIDHGDGRGQMQGTDISAETGGRLCCLPGGGWWGLLPSSLRGCQ
jgi:hypothetical protein